MLYVDRKTYRCLSRSVVSKFGLVEDVELVEAFEVVEVVKVLEFVDV